MLTQKRLPHDGASFPKKNPMKNKYTIKSGDYDFILEFSFSPDQPLRINTESLDVDTSHSSGIEESKYIEILAYRSDNVANVYHAIHQTGNQVQIPVELNCSDAHNLHGTISIIQNKTSEQHIVWVDLHCGPKDSALNFMGTLSPLMNDY